MTDDSRIQQFKQITEADPDNELGHFSLGKAYFDAGRFGDAIGPLSRVLELRPETSKAYQLLGDAYARTAERDKAVEIVTRGVTVADEQGDHMPRDAMITLLSEWGAPVPELKASQRPTPAPGRASGEGGEGCSRCGRPGGRLEKPPFKGELGQKVFQHVCATCWREWIMMGTKVINELGLVLSTKEHQDVYDQYMVEFLQLENR